MKDLTFIKVKEGKLLASDMVKPNYSSFCNDGTRTCNGNEDFEKAMEAFNQSFVEVGNPDDVLQARPELFAYVDEETTEVADGLYSVDPVSGLQFEVREEPEYVGASESTSYPTFRKIAILSIKSQSKCCKLNPNGCEDCTEFHKLNTPPAVAILSLKQEQPSEEKEGEVGKFLKRNGFNLIEENSYSNGLCNVVVEEDHYALANNEGDTMYSPNLNIYWLIGALTYLGFMDKNYVD